MKFKYLIFIPSLILGTFITLSSSSWLSAWVGLEINLMSFAPILINKMSAYSVEASIKYFIVQALASTLLIYFIFLLVSYNSFNFLNFFEVVLLISLLMKAGVAPLHFWFPQVMQCSDWPRCLILLTWQKFAPLILMSFMNNLFLWVAVVSSAFLGVLGAMNQVQMKMIMAYSSITHSAWMISIVSFNELLWLIYFLAYIFITFSVSYLFMLFNMSNLVDLQFIKLNPSNKLIFLMNLFSMAGLPPFLGFLIKLLTVLALIKMTYNILIIAILILSSFLAFYFYMRVMYSSLFFNSSLTLLPLIKYLNNSSFTFFILLSFLGNMLLPLMILLI